MKFTYRLLCLLLTLTICNSTFAEITEEMYRALEQRLQRVEKTMHGVNNYFIKVDNIESDFAGLKTQIEETKGSIPVVYNNNDDSKVNDRLKMLEDSVFELKDRATLMDMTEEIRRVKEYVCPNGHVYPDFGTNKKCPIDGLKQKSRNRYKLHKFARRESISERIGSAIEEEFDRRIIIGASGTGIYQQIVSSDKKEQGFAEGSFDLLFISKPLLYTTFFIDLEAIGGNGPDEVISSFSGINDDSGSLQDDDGVDRLSVREVWLQSYFFDERLQVVGGKIDLTNYFDSNAVANDETTQFITSAFVNNPTMEVPENGPGVVAFFDTRKGFHFGLGLQSADNSGFNITDSIYAIAEIGYRSHFFFGQEGHYRIWGRINGGRDDNRGFGVSIDQNLTTRLTLFARYGANEDNGSSNRDKDGDGIIDLDLGDNDTDIASAWSAGLRLRSPFFSRVNDEVAFAFGSLDTVGGNDESAAEIYYKFHINDHFAITPNFQAIFDPAGIGSDDTVAVAGIRTQIEF